MYRPNFCCECGERIARVRWRAWTSRCFCDSCGRRFRRERFTTPVLLAAALAGAGFLSGRLARPSSPPLILERSRPGLVAPLPTPDALRQSDVKREGTATKPESTKPEPAYGPDGTANERPTETDEVVYICGARTKKGTPCQRRVRGPGRCWQHRGMPAILPPSKLIVPG
ncbi:MAG: hypothetical protein QOC99_205 [Acidobacteriota bacterium]|nr:hypothetical protein [Acidobacteriota bacterium]MDT7777693.1 hypothetical protein [Acidobacteriota bacterium]